MVSHRRWAHQCLECLHLQVPSIPHALFWFTSYSLYTCQVEFTANAFHAFLSSWLACREGHSVFFTGCAGTGKSLLLKHILRTVPKDSTFVTASTGLAASALGGTTINAFAGERLSLLCHWACSALHAASALPF